MEFVLQQLLVRKLRLVFRNQRWRQAAAERVFHHLIILACAQKHADGRLLMRFAHVAIEGLQIKVELAQELRLELANLQLNGDKAVEATVKEEQVECEISPANLYRVFGANEAEVPAQLDQERPQLLQESPMQVRFRMHEGQSEELQVVGVLEDADRVGVTLSYHRRDFWRAEHYALEKRGTKLTLQFSFAPPLSDRDTEVELALFLSFALSKNDQVMGPRQLSYQWCDFLVPVVGFVKLPHPEEIRSRKAAQARLGLRDVVG